MHLLALLVPGVGMGGGDGSLAPEIGGARVYVRSQSSAVHLRSQSSAALIDSRSSAVHIRSTQEQDA